MRATRLTRAVLLALEEDRFEDLAAPVYVRGFIRIYSQFLEIDAEQLLEGYEAQTAARAELTAAIMPLDEPQLATMPDYFRDHARPIRGLSPAQLVLLAATAAIIAVFAYQARGKRAVQTAANRGQTVAPATAAAPAQLVPAPAQPVSRRPLPPPASHAGPAPLGATPGAIR